MNYNTVKKTKEKFQKKVLSSFNFNFNEGLKHRNKSRLPGL